MVRFAPWSVRRGKCGNRGGRPGVCNVPPRAAAYLTSNSASEIQAMCGIAGILDLRGKREPDRSEVAAMTECITHRGPDEDGFLYAPGIAAGQRRLSIVGLSDGRQP